MFRILILGLLAIASAEAAPRQGGASLTTSKKYRAGVDFGLGIPTTDTFGSARAIVGVDFYIVHDESIDFGVSYLTGGSHVERTNRHWRTNFVGGELNFKQPQIAPGFYLGASAGIASFDGGDHYFPGVDDFYFGPKAGFYRMITPEISWGLEGKLLFVTSSPILAWIDALGSFHYHF